MDKLQGIVEQVKDFLEITLFVSGNFEVHVFNILNILLIFLVARAVMWLFKKFLRRANKSEIDQGKQYAIVQLVSYVVYVLAIVLAMESLGVNMYTLLVGSTALLVGLGLGLQDFFRDLVAGFIILSQRTVTAGDVVEIAGTVGKVQDVGLRTTSLLTREDIVIIVPNTKLTNENVINWSQNNTKVTRFDIKVGVAYGSDTEVVKQLLVKSAASHKDVMKVPEPNVFFENFGESALQFRLNFYSQNLFRIERTKSDIRFAIDKSFREAGVKIPFPQRDLWVRQLPEQP
jgi:small-conductance mechanosensitive channel